MGWRALSRGGTSLPPAPDDVFFGLAGRDFGIEPHQDVQMIIHNREPADCDREDARKFPQPIVDPELAVAGAFTVTEQESAADAADDAVVPAGDGGID